MYRCCTVIILCFVASVCNIDSSSQSTGNDLYLLIVHVVWSLFQHLAACQGPSSLSSHCLDLTHVVCLDTFRSSCLYSSLHFVYSQQLQKFNSPGLLSIINIDQKVTTFADYFHVLCKPIMVVISALTNYGIIISV